MIDRFSKLREEHGKLLGHNEKIQKEIKVLENLDASEESEYEPFAQVKQSIELTDYEKSKCSRSYCIFPNKNLIRIFCFKITQNPKFESILLVLICANSVKLTWDTYISNYSQFSTQYQVSTILSNFFTVCYAIEFLMKSIAIGFAFEEDLLTKFLECFRFLNSCFVTY